MISPAFHCRSMSLGRREPPLLRPVPVGLGLLNLGTWADADAFEEEKEVEEEEEEELKDADELVVAEKGA